jgi:hypothetical protein
MKNIILATCLLISINTYAQFIEGKAPTKKELEINNTNNVPALMKQAFAVKRDEDYVNLIRILKKAIKIEPFSPSIQYQLAEAYALNDDKSEAFDALIQIQKQGFYFDLANNNSLSNINSFPVFKYIKENMDANNQHFGEGVEAFNINKSFSGLLFESIAYDSKNQAVLMGSLRDGRVIKIGNDGSISNLIPPAKGGKTGPWAVVDLAVDAKNDVLWVASSAVSQFGKVNKESSGLSGVFKYQLSNGRFIKSYLLPTKGGPSLIRSMHLTKQGDLYLVESIRNLILKLPKGEDIFHIAFETKEYKHLNRITSDETGKVLYVSDDKKGILILNLEQKEVYTISNKVELNLTDISDLIFDDNGLIIIQNGFKPERIMRLQLNKNKFVVDHVFPIEVANPKFNVPTYGVVIEEGLFYIANSQAPKTNLLGGLNKGNQWEDVVVLSSPKHYKEKETLEYQDTVKNYKFDPKTAKKGGNTEKLEDKQ